MKDTALKENAVNDKLNGRKINWISLIAATSLILTLVLEMLNRASFTEAFVFAFSHLGIFLLNVLLVADTLTICVFFKRRLFVYLTVTLLWLTVGIVNMVIVAYRTLPFTIIDVTLIKEALRIFDVYFNLPQRILIIALFLLLAAVIIFLFIKMPRRPRAKVKKSVPSALILALLTIGSLNLVFNTGVIDPEISNLSNAYAEYGFSYVFLRTFMDVGISQPDDYGEEAISTIQNELESVGETSYYSTRPNIIFVQLESFFDPKHVKSLEVTEDPVPNYTALKENYPSGYLTMPSVGGGTVNSEFEVLSGMTLTHFGAGEYPYNTVLQSQAIESICYNLDSLGYTSTAIHDNTGTFYTRNLVYTNLGFDRFVPLEYMYGYQTNALGYCKDAILTSEITEALDSTEGADFIFTVTMQSHGRYPTESMVDESDSLIDEFENDTASYTGMDYYLQEIHDVDTFIGDLTSTLEKSDEPTVVVFYGDHLPSLGLTNEDLDNGDLYQTEYVIWNNYSGKLSRVADKDLYAYQLSAYVTDLLNIREGDISKIHQSYLSGLETDEETYMSNLKEFEYDALYGDKIATSGEQAYTPTDMKFGIKDITISGMYVSDGALVVTGSEFTSASELFYDDRQIETIYVSPTILVATEVPAEGSTISVGQVATDHSVLSYSNSMVMPASE